MPFSSIEGKDWLKTQVSEWAKHVSVQDVLDVGAGSGYYWDLLGPILPKAHWTAIEVWAPYVSYFGLKEKYDRIFIVNARHWSPERHYDLVLMGDVLEHMEPEDAQDLVQRMLPTCSLLVISIPIIPMPQGMVFGNPYERHIKEDWSHEEIMLSFPDIACYSRGKSIGVYLLSRNIQVLDWLNQA